MQYSIISSIKCMILKPTQSLIFFIIYLVIYYKYSTIKLLNIFSQIYFSL